MSREIKFRAWNKHQKCWEEEGWGIQKHIPWSNSESHKTGMTVYWLKWIDDFDTVGYEPFWVFHTVARDLELSQYTGLKDKNGREIYEGDIILYKDYQIEYLIEWEPVLSAIIAVDTSNNSWIFFHELIKDLEYYETIGNIYENPELSKQCGN